MKHKLIILLVTIFLFPSSVFAHDNTLIWPNINVSNYVLLFLNLNTSKSYATQVDEQGRFNFSQGDITDNASLNELVKVNVCSNLIPSKYNRDIIYCNGTVGYFYTVEDSSSLDIYVNSRKSYWPDYTSSIRNTCSDENLFFCSVVLGNGTNIFYNSKFKSGSYLSQRSVKTYTFDDVTLDILPSLGIYSLSLFASDGPNSVLGMDQFRVAYITVKNPYPEKRKVIIRTNQAGCLLENGQQEIEKLVDSQKEIKTPVFSDTSIRCTKIDINFIKIESQISKISIGGFEINIITISIYLFGISFLGFSIYIVYLISKRISKK